MRGATPNAAGDLTKLARETYLDGCIGETLAAIDAAEDAERECDPEVARVLRRIARDEASHAALAFRIVRWALGEGGAPTAAAIAALMPLRDSRVAIREVVLPCSRAMLAIQ